MLVTSPRPPGRTAVTTLRNPQAFKPTIPSPKKGEL
jgi:hypothetical protein